MRDFDDVSPNLQSLRNGQSLSVSDAPQRLTDLRGAGLVDTAGALTPLGSGALQAWEKYGVANSKKSDELARHVLLLLEAEKLGDATYEQYRTYWRDLRSFFPAEDLIENWDALYTLNYLDFEHDGYAPGTSFRDEAVPVQDIEFDLTDYARNGAGSAEAVAGASSVETAIAGKLPRGRHRATFTIAMEIIESAGQNLVDLTTRFGFPKRPRSWDQFAPNVQQQLQQILADYAVSTAPRRPPASAATPAAGPTPAPATAPSPEAPALSLPPNLDYSKVLVSPPKPKPKPTLQGVRAKSPRKVNHIKKALKDDAVGKLGEDFAVQFEMWRLRGHPDLLKQIDHVSKRDDTLGYDILSFETDGRLRHVEVKSTLGPLETRFFMSANELAFALANKATAVILRVGDLPDHPKCCEIRDPLDSAVELTPDSYSVTFKSDP